MIAKWVYDDLHIFSAFQIESGRKKKMKRLNEALNMAAGKKVRGIRQVLILEAAIDI